jgi:hypothetical protein
MAAKSCGDKTATFIVFQAASRPRLLMPVRVTVPPADVVDCLDAMT